MESIGASSWRAYARYRRAVQVRGQWQDDCRRDGEPHYTVLVGQRVVMQWTLSRSHLGFASSIVDECYVDVVVQSRLI